MRIHLRRRQNIDDENYAAAQNEAAERFSRNLLRLGCNADLTMTAGKAIQEMYWSTPNYDGVTKLASSAQTCTLKITIPATLTLFFVHMELQTPSLIYETSGCGGDNLVYTASSGTSVRICGTVSGQSWSELQIFDGPKSFSFTWTSVADGGTAVGFKLMITGYDLTGK
ncbi:unnamed protein product, partial [Meganyctiphanes norvegica]